MDLSIVIPVYNEEANLESLYRELRAVLAATGRQYEIIFIDDGSRDGSPALLRRLQQEDKAVKVMMFKRNFGQTAALAAGIEHSSGTVVITMDGDGQNDPASIPDLLAKLDEGYDMVCGWRKERHDGFLLRRFPSMIANRIISLATKVPLHDNGCTLKAVRREAINDIALYGELHRFISVLVAWSGSKFAEIPVRHRARKYGQSKYGIQRTFKVLLDLLTLIFLRSYATKPIYLFGGVGIVMFGMSVLCFGFALYQKFAHDMFLQFNPLIILTVLLFIVSGLFTLVGLVAEIMIRTYYESTKKPIYLVREKCGW